MVVAIWSGNSKPPLNEYFLHFKDELKGILSKEMFINEHSVKIKLGRFIGDTPARAFMKGMHA